MDDHVKSNVVICGNHNDILRLLEFIRIEDNQNPDLRYSFTQKVSEKKVIEYRCDKISIESVRIEFDTYTEDDPPLFEMSELSRIFPKLCFIINWQHSTNWINRGVCHIQEGEIKEKFYKGCYYKGINYDIVSEFSEENVAIGIDSIYLLKEKGKLEFSGPEEINWDTLIQHLLPIASSEQMPNVDAIGVVYSRSRFAYLITLKNICDFFEGEKNYDDLYMYVITSVRKITSKQDFELYGRLMHNLHVIALFCYSHRIEYSIYHKRAIDLYYTDDSEIRAAKCAAYGEPDHLLRETMQNVAEETSLSISKSVPFDIPPEDDLNEMLKAAI